ncbi:hypothetical protein POM88_024507 [Heracleum sosnowskyi]|uniref:F-box associated beta-propeller type 3 domain-containing protein n=1 Tax=Heracleum sosnowskyi TaxID=360622 RepID=A0AAD8MMX9_9APIA|nr:hypothetical protein POM88_024507 [Heracleum sosnowskyi]
MLNGHLLLVVKDFVCIISSPGFIESHCTRPGSYSETTLIIHEDEGHLDGWFPLFQLGPSLLRTDLHFPCFGCGSDESTSKIVASDRGIVCVTVCGNPFHMSYSDPGNTYLWNPATKHYKLISPNISDDYTQIMALGFGFDPIDKDFEVIRVVNSHSRAEVYSANLNSWQKVGPKPMHDQYVWDFRGCNNELLCWTELHYILTFDFKYLCY